MNTKTISAVALTAALGLAVPAMALAGSGESQQINIAPMIVLSADAGVETWDGDITYQIGYPVTDVWGYKYEGYFPFSELTFPLDISFGTVGAELRIADRWTVGIEYKTNIDDPGDYMEDRDWITDSNPGQLDIYSDSEITDFKADIVDIDVNYRFWENDKVSFAAGIGYLYQDFHYDCALIRQWSPSGYTGYDYVGDGSVGLIYDVEFEIPYMALTASVHPIPNLSLNGRVAWAPWVQVDDRDQHLLRYKENTGDLEGDAAMASFDVNYDILPFLFVQGGVEYTYVNVDGEMTATFYGISDHTVYEELESNQTSVFGKIGFRLGVQ